MYLSCRGTSGRRSRAVFPRRCVRHRGFLLIARPGRISGPLLQGSTPTLENTTMPVIQTLDLGVMVLLLRSVSQQPATD